VLEEDPDVLDDPEEELEDETEFVTVLEIVLEIVPDAVIVPDELVEPVAVLDPEAETVFEGVGSAVSVCVFDPEEDPDVLGELLTVPEFVTEPLPETVFVLETVIVGDPVFVTVLECVWLAELLGDVVAEFVEVLLTDALAVIVTLFVALYDGWDVVEPVKVA
jgi:hypothetical protein